MAIGTETGLDGRVIAVVNVGSGRADAAAGGRIGEIFASAGLGRSEVINVTARHVNRALADAIARADVLVALGGDGTIRAAAAGCGKAGKRLIPLAGGTMNLLARSLYGELSWDRALVDTLADPEVRAISGGDAEGHLFFCAAIFGAPSLWADAREAVRRGALIEALRRSVTAIRRAGEVLDFQLGDEPPGAAEAVVVICPLVSSALPSGATSLEAAALHSTAAGSMFRLAFHAVFDDWRKDPSISLAKVKSLSVRGHGRIPAILDGEKVFLGRSARVCFVPLAFHAITPARPAQNLGEEAAFKGGQ